MKSLQSHLMKKLFVLKSSGILNAIFLHNLVVIMLRFKFWSEIFLGDCTFQAKHTTSDYILALL